MSLSPLVYFKSRFVTYLLNFPRISIVFHLVRTSNDITHQAQVL